MTDTDRNARRRRGRPPLAADGHATNLKVRLPDDQYDKVCRQAMREGLSVPAVIRRLVSQTTEPGDDE